MIVYHFTLWALLGFAIQGVLPLVVDLVTTTETRKGVKTIILALLTLIGTVGGGLLNAHNTGTEYDLASGLFTSLIAFLVSIAAYYKVWKNSRASAAAQSVLVTAKTPEPETDPENPSPAALSDALPARHLSVAPTVPEDETAGGDHRLAG
jgi:hypothetical protein